MVGYLGWGYLFIPKFNDWNQLIFVFYLQYFIIKLIFNLYRLIYF